MNTYGRFVVSALSLVPERTHPKKNGDHLEFKIIPQNFMTMYSESTSICCAIVTRMQ